jgi:hypothetical protein
LVLGGFRELPQVLYQEGKLQNTKTGIFLQVTPRRHLPSVIHPQGRLQCLATGGTIKKADALRGKKGAAGIR